VPVVAHYETLPPGVPDEEWLRFTAENRYIALTKDERLSKNPLEIEAIFASGARVVVFSVGAANAGELGELAKVVVPKIIRSVGPRQSGCIFKVTRSGVLTEFRIRKRRRRIR
jgi:hypothetical protein